MPKLVGSTGATKLKILAIICHNGGCGKDSYGYDIWKNLQDSFHCYLNDSDIGNVYHHLTGLCKSEHVTRLDQTQLEDRCFYTMTQKGWDLQPKFQPYLDIIVSSQKPSVA